MSTYKGSGLPPDQGVDPDQRVLDEAGEVEKPFLDDAHRWGVAVYHDERPGRFRVVRYADRERAERVAYASNDVEVEWAHSGRRGKGHVTPIVWCQRSDAGVWGHWYFAATGWDVPL